MTSVRETAKQMISLGTDGLDPGPDRRALLLRFLIWQSRHSQRAFDTVREIYQLAAMREWCPTLRDLSTLIYAPLDNPALIPEIQLDVGRMLDDYPGSQQLRSGWRYVQTFSPRTKREW
jgi:hypothetical protein